MTRSFTEMLRRESGRGCVGREELQYRLLLEYAREAPRIVMLVGSGGGGKTTLANWLRSHVCDRGGAVGWVSGEQVAPNSEAILDSLRVLRSDGTTGELTELGRNPAARDLLVIDSGEKLTALLPWLFGEMLSAIGDNLLVMLASRERLSLRERQALGLLDALVEIEVANLDEIDARRLLAATEIPESSWPEILDFTRGHPLALRLIAERHANAPHEALSVNRIADVIDSLVEAFLSSAPTPAHARAIYALSLARNTDEELLAAMLDDATQAPELFRWLSRLSFVERTTDGLSPHALVRDVLFSDLIRRTPDLLERLQARAIDVLMPRIVSQDISAGHQWYLRALYVRRNAIQLDNMVNLEAAQHFHIASINPGNVEQTRALIRQFEGDVGVASFDAWRPRWHLPWLIVDDKGKIAAIEIVIRVPRDARAEDLTDPVIAGAWHAWKKTDPNPDQGDFFLFRWFFSATSYQTFTMGDAHLLNLGPLLTLPHYDEIQHLGFVTSSPETWVPLAPSFGLRHLVGETTSFGDRTYGYFVGSQRPRDLAVKDVQLNATRDVIYRQIGLPPPSGELMRATRVTLSREEFNEAVRGAIEQLHAPHVLRQSRLATVVDAQDSDGTRPAETRIAQWITVAIQKMKTNAGTARMGEILHATYVIPLAKQQAAAFDLGLPYGTYRYQLRKALSVLEEELWQGVAGGAPTANSRR